MAIPIQAVAHAILQKNKAENRDTTPLQLIKLAYLAHGWHLAFFGENLFPDQVEAWPYGPVIPSLYSRVKMFKGDSIDTELFSNEVNSELSDTQQHTIKEVMRVYGKNNGMQLSTLTHQKGTPWSNTSKGDVIYNELIKEHFSEILNKAKAEKAL